MSHWFGKLRLAIPGMRSFSERRFGRAAVEFAVGWLILPLFGRVSLLLQPSLAAMLIANPVVPLFLIFLFGRYSVERNLGPPTGSAPFESSRVTLSCFQMAFAIVVGSALQKAYVLDRVAVQDIQFLTASLRNGDSLLIDKAVSVNELRPNDIIAIRCESCASGICMRKVADIEGGKIRITGESNLPDPEGPTILPARFLGRAIVIVFSWDEGGLHWERTGKPLLARLGA